MKIYISVTLLARVVSVQDNDGQGYWVGLEYDGGSSVEMLNDAPVVGQEMRITVQR